MGDPQFPDAILKRPQTQRILLLQKIFETYSELSLSVATDRSVAIYGLEKRLAKAFYSRSSYGILDSYRHHCLLWQRAGEKPLRRIKYPKKRTVPSWSWMAYEGTIRYLDVPTEGMSWSKLLNFLPALDPQGNGLGNDAAPARWFKATVSRLAVQELQKEPWRLIMDDPDTVDVDNISGIIIGMHEDVKNAAVQYLVVAVAARFLGGYQRVGVGRIEERHLLQGQSGVEGLVI
jgi:hypothetical protein